MNPKCDVAEAREQISFVSLQSFLTADLFVSLDVLVLSLFFFIFFFSRNTTFARLCPVKTHQQTFPVTAFIRNFPSSLRVCGCGFDPGMLRGPARDLIFWKLEEDFIH